MAICKICGKPVLPPKTKYCSAECQAAGKVKSSYSTNEAKLLEKSTAKMRAKTCVVKKRRCLRCDARFTSDGPFNRICGKCKALEAVGQGFSYREAGAAVMGCSE